MTQLINRNGLLIMSYSFYLLPLSLMTGPFVPGLLLTLIAIIFLFLTFKDKEFKYYSNSFFFISLIFYFIILISSILSDYILFSLESSLFYFRFLIFALATWYLIEKNDKFISIFTYVLLATFIFAIVDGYYQYINDQSIFGFSNEHPFRLTLPLDDKLYMGGYLSRIFPPLLALLISNFKLKIINYIFLGLLLIITDVLVYISAERTALVLLSVSTLTILILMSKFKLLRLCTIVFSLIIIISISFISPEIKERNIDHTMSQIGINKESNKINLFSPRHESHFIGAIKMFSSNKIIGVGPNVFRKVCHLEEYKHNNLTCTSHPHNTYLQLLAETGIIGFFIYCIFLFYVVKILIQHFFSIIRKKEPLITDYQVCLIATILLTLWPLAPTLNFFNSWINIIYFLPIGFYLHTIYSKLRSD